MLLKFKREDEEFGVVQVELLQDSKTGHLIRLRRRYNVSGQNAKQDYYKDATPITFEKELQKEIDRLSNLLYSIADMQRKEEELENFEEILNGESYVKKLQNKGLKD